MGRKLDYQVTVKDPAIGPGDPQFAYPQTGTLLDTAEAANMALSQMADSKSSILMGASFVVFSLSINGVADGTAGLPIVLLSLFSFAATVLGVMTVRPARMKAFKVTPDQANLLYFGSYANITKQEYEEAMLRALASEEDAYRHMARSIYDHGCVLRKEKYRWLYWSYTLFLMGLFLTFASVLYERFSAKVQPEAGTGLLSLHSPVSTKR